MTTTDSKPGTVLRLPHSGNAATERGSLVSRIRRAVYSGLTRPRVRYRSLVESHAATAGRILDIGCGYTAPDLQAIDAPCQADRIGIDVVDEFRPDAAPGVQFLQASCSALPLQDGSVDLVMCRSVLEHLSEPERMFAEVGRVLRPGGTFVFLTPNRWDYVSVAASLIPNRFHGSLVRRLTGRNEEDTFPTVYRANSGRAIRRLVKDTPLQLDSLEYVREHPHYLKFNSVAYLAGVLIEQGVQRPCRALRPWILGVCSKPSAASDWTPAIVSDGFEHQ